MKKISFIHLSDIHFMKSSNNSTDIDKELREAIITDLIINANKELDNVVGILVTGDIAFSGTTIEYENAKTYLNEISKIFSIDPSDIYCVPGNHDVNRATVTNSAIISQAQSVIDESKCVDSADEAFSKTLTDTLFNNVLFEPIREYNEFANRFNCSITPERITWSSDFDLEYELKLRLFGINSCYLSSSHDNLVYVGQAQIPPREPDTVVLLMCHHPPGCWKFKDDIIVRINKRADIQLYGHIHMQSVELTNSNAILFSGATHPQRAEDWYPRYNWITISSEKINGDRYLRIEIYPRILSDDRDHFKADEGNTTNGISLQHLINIDEKRRSDLVDSCQELNGSTNPKANNIINRWNPPDKRYLYLVAGKGTPEDTETAFQEMRIKPGELVTLANFEVCDAAKKAIIIDLDYENILRNDIFDFAERTEKEQVNRIVRQIAESGMSPTEEYVKQQINLEDSKTKWLANAFVGKLLLKEICDAIFAPLDENEDNDNDEKDKCYKAYHILAEYFENRGYGGICYPSTRMKLIKKQGSNLVLFNADSATPIQESFRSIERQA